MKTKTMKINPKNPQKSKIKKAANLIREGKLVAFPTETVYGLGANALDSNAITKIFRAKGRPSDNPLIIHIYDKNDIYFLAKDVSKTAKKIIDKFWPGPLTIVLRKSELVPKIATGGLNTVAIRMPKNKIARELIKEAGVPIAAPSANIAGKPSPTLAEHVRKDLSGRIDLILDGGSAKIGIESTVIDLSAKKPVLLRPGGITVEQLKKIIHIDLHPILQGKKSKFISRSPGMKYRHYSPIAKIILIEGSKQKVDERISQLACMYGKKRKRVGIMSTRKRFHDRTHMVEYIGNNPRQVASNLFKAFRKFDAKNIDIVLVGGMQRKGLGLGIMNRLGKAAHKTIFVQ
ncbi:MAG TPA: L-threonylcarbamoyladenylate synthase [Candidatus Nitrosotenuis sp.]|nr:L-threonylcarbamoyladenylate synthase [Candidatus Nitrosotenuis sp.]